MRIVMFYHSVLSDWNHGNAHFLRGVATELISRGHSVDIYESYDSWSLKELIKEHGEEPVHGFHQQYPYLSSERYHPDLDLDEALDRADVVLVHEWNEPEFVRRIGEHKAESKGYKLLFHDTHHRAVTAPAELSKYHLEHYDGVLAFGEVLREIYLNKGWAKQAWTWHEAADTRVFFPRSSQDKTGDLVWIGNWGDDERTSELGEFLFEPIRELGFKAKVFGVRYPEKAIRELERSGIEYSGWLPNFRVPETFASYRMTVHIPRRPYSEALPGIPTIRPFEAMACGIPLICAPWSDAEGLFTEGKDYLTARNGTEMKELMARLINDEGLCMQLTNHALRTIRDRHTCVHRVDELLEICDEIGSPPRARRAMV